MKIVTIMNYPDEPNFNVMCIGFLGQALKHSIGKIDVLTENPLPPSVQGFVDKYGGDRIRVNTKHRRDISSLNVNPAVLKKAQHNVGFKLNNLCQETDPFIFIDADSFLLKNIDSLIEAAKDKPFICVDHQKIQGHTAHLPYDFLNSGMQVVGDPRFLDFDKIVDQYKKDGKFVIPGTDQAMIFGYCNAIGYDYTHPNVGFGWNSCAGFTRYNRDLTAECVGLGESYPVFLNHYWYNYKPWTLNCPIFRLYKNLLENGKKSKFLAHLIEND